MTSSAFSTELWDCSVCTFKSKPSTNVCEMCGSMKQSDDGGLQWQCVLCSVMNNSIQSACIQCSAPSPMSNDLSGKIICPHCTSINLDTDFNCKTCLQSLTATEVIAMNEDQIPIENEISNIMEIDEHSQNITKVQQFINNNDQNMDAFVQPPIPTFNNIAQNQPTLYAQAQSIAGNFFDTFSWNPANANIPKKKKKSGHRSRKKSRHSNNNNNNESEIQFKDASEFINHESEEERIKKEEKEIVILADWYKHVYLTLHSKKQKKQKKIKKMIEDIICAMIDFIPVEHMKDFPVQKSSESKVDDQKSTANENTIKDSTCKVCFMDFDDDNQRIEMKEYCTHSMICESCFTQHLEIKIKEDDITPFIMCAAEDCKAPVSPQLLLKYLSITNLYKFACAFIRKHLARNANWVQCRSKKCEYGWVLLGNDLQKKHRKKCGACGKTHVICKDPFAADEGYQKLLKEGIIRPCPKCALATMKDKGMCNIINCGKCGIFWNWRTNEIGTSSSQLKNKARMNGTLWEAGELQFQQQLQKTDLPEFIKLLEKNGITYDPNYRRGQ